MGLSPKLLYTIWGLAMWFNQIIILKETASLTLRSRPVFGGLIPYIFMQLTGRDRFERAEIGVVFLGYWAIRGVDVDCFTLEQCFLGRRWIL